MWSKVLALCLIMFIKDVAYSQDDKFINTAFLDFTFQLQYKDYGATGFAYRDSIGRCFIITVRHLFVDKIKKINRFGKAELTDSLPYKNGDSVQLSFYSDGWQKGKAPVYFYNDSTDVAVIKVDGLVGVNVFHLSTDGLSLGQDCFFLGYPLGKSSDVKGLDLPHPFPFVNKGVISGVLVGKSNAMDLIFISSSNTFGYSGGPVIFFDYFQKYWKVCGVVNGYVTQDDLVEYQNGSSLSYKENSGIMYATPIFFAIRIINSIK